MIIKDLLVDCNNETVFGDERAEGRLQHGRCLSGKTLGVAGFDLKSTQVGSVKWRHAS
ncbi:MAG: hypothetical protein H6936_15910 [Burkholderiales bacterium]|nr:hypothetical protein [Burkholderiales bacterium]